MAPAVPWFPSRERLRSRELGGRGCRPTAFAAEVSRRRCDAATLSGDKTFVHRWAGGINCLELDESESRYLLAGTVDAVIAVYDTEQPTVVDHATGAARHGKGGAGAKNLGSGEGLQHKTTIDDSLSLSSLSLIYRKPSL